MATSKEVAIFFYFWKKEIMKIILEKGNNSFEANLSQPLDISIPLEAGDQTVNCFFAPPMQTWPVVAGDFIGLRKYSPVNFLNIKLNPHGNGTHTECVGHIAKEKYSINQSLQNFHFFAKLISVIPTEMENGDHVILKEQLEPLFEKNEAEAIVIRTLPNKKKKLKKNYSGSNPTYVHYKATQYLVDCGVQHLLIDLPSVDREEDEGELLSHHTFWQYPKATRENCTISELIFVKDEISDGMYLLNISIASFEIDVSPSKPVLYKLNRVYSISPR